jgi:hypothetical protein
MVWFAARVAPPLLLLLLLTERHGGAQACDGGTVCKKNGCELSAPGEDRCPHSCVVHEVSHHPVSGAPICTCSQCGDNHNACVDAYSSWICDGLGPISTLYTGSFGLFAIMALAWCCMPCITFGVAQTTCIGAKRNQGREPKPSAWLVCVGVITFCGLFGTSISLGWSWLIFSFLMVIPFALDSCYEEPRAQNAQINIVTYSQQPQLVVQYQQPMMVQQPPMMVQQQPMMMQQQPMMPQAAAPQYAPQYAPPAFNPAQQQGQVIQATFVNE